MSFKSFDTLLQPDPRFADLCFVTRNRVHRLTLLSHHAGVANLALTGAAPDDVCGAFDRARNIMVYAFFDYDLLVVGEVQAFGAVELALRFRMNGHGGAARGTLRNLVDRARKAAILPPIDHPAGRLSDPIEALIDLRNGLAHGNADIHTFGMAMDVVAACSRCIDYLFPPQD